MVVGRPLGLRIGGLVAVNSHAENVAFSQHLVRPDTGAVVWQAEGTVSALDHLGVLCTHLMDATVLRDREGAVRWRSVTGGRPGGMSSSRVVQHVPEGLSPLTGATEGAWRRCPSPMSTSSMETSWCVSMAQSWRPSPPTASRSRTYQNDEVIHSIAPYPGRIYGLTRQKTVVCLEDDISALAPIGLTPPAVCASAQRVVAEKVQHGGLPVVPPRVGDPVRPAGVVAPAGRE